MKKLIVSCAAVLIVCIQIVCMQTALSHASVTDVEAFVTRFYQQCLSRQPDQAGLDYWTNSLLAGTLTGADVAYGFVFSTEFTNLNTSNEDFLTVLYVAFFDRNPDPGGYDYWLSQLNSGVSREDVLDGFIYAQEFYNLCYDYGISPNLVSAFVQRFYLQCLSRPPDLAGLSYWVNSLLDGSQTGADVAHGFVFSTEFTNLGTSNADYLTVLYRAFFDREADPGGWNYWMAKLNNFASREYVLDGFIGSDEFIALCNTYGVDPFCDSGSFYPTTSGYWRYRVNGGQPVTSYFEGITMTMQLNDIDMSIDANSSAMNAYMAGTISADGYSGNISANFGALNNTGIMDMQFDLGGLGEYLGFQFYVEINYDQPIYLFLDRCDLDRLPIGYFYDEQGLISGTANGFIRIYGDLNEYEPIDNVYVTAPTDSWQIVDKLPSYAVNGVTYQNVVVVERYTQVPDYDLTSTEYVTITYWVAKGVGMIRSMGHFRILNQPLVTELVEARLP